MENEAFSSDFSFLNYFLCQLSLADLTEHYSFEILDYMETKKIFWINVGMWNDSLIKL